MSYLLDTNIFIQAKNLHYGFDFCPAFWDWLIEKSKQNSVLSIDKVADEIMHGNDKLSQWVLQQDNSMFRQTNASVIPHLNKIGNWATQQNYKQAAIDTFLQGADYYLIAHALATESVVVTHEVSSGSNKGSARIKIPDACVGLGVGCTTIYDLLRKEQARFVLGETEGL